MSLYNINNSKLELIKKVDFKYERELQKLTEDNLEELFGLKFVATEFQLDNLRIDTLAFNEETKSFVIIEYKKGKSYSVIDQGYSYLSLLLNNKAEFVLKYNQKFDKNYGKEDIDFSQSVVMFIAPSYTTYQLKSIEFNDLAFELWKVTKFSNNTVLYDQINVSENKASIKEVSSTQANTKNAKVDKEIKKYTVDDVFKGKENMLDFYYEIKDKIENEFDEVIIKATKLYLVFKVNNKIFLSLQPRAKSLKIWINMPVGKLYDPENITRDVSKKGHHGVGNYDMILNPDDDIYYFMSLVKQAYDDKFN